MLSSFLANCIQSFACRYYSSITTILFGGSIHMLYQLKIGCQNSVPFTLIVIQGFLIELLVLQVNLAVIGLRPTGTRCKVLLYERCMKVCQILLISFFLIVINSIPLFYFIWLYTSLEECEVGGCSIAYSCNHVTACSHCSE